MAYFPYGGYGGFSGYGGFVVDSYEPVVLAPAFWVLDIQPAWYGYFSWMQTDIMEIWQRWQEMLAHGHYTLEQRRSLLSNELRMNSSLSGWELNDTVDRIMEMEHELGANQYGVVDTTVQITSTTTTTTTSKFTQEQLNEAATQYLTHLNESGATIDPQEAQQRRDQILNGQADPLAEVMLQQRQSNVARQNQQQQQLVQQHSMPQPSLIQQPNTPTAQYGLHQQSVFQQQNTAAPQTAMHGQGTRHLQIPQAVFQQQGAAANHGSQYQGMQQQLTPVGFQHGVQHALSPGQQQAAAQEMQTMTTTSTTTTSSNNFDTRGQQLPVGNQQQPQRQTTPTPHNPTAMAQFNQQKVMPHALQQTPSPQGYQQPSISNSYFPQQPQVRSQAGESPPQPTADRPPPPARMLTPKEKRDARMAQKGGRKK